MQTDMVLFDGPGHKVVMMSHETEEAQAGYIGTNQYLIVSADESVLLDPGGQMMFSSILSSVKSHIPLSNITYLFISHQDPDVASSVSLWLGATPAKVIMSKWWERFIPLFGISDLGRIISVEDGGMMLNFQNSKQLMILPAHFLHSSASLCIYDPTSKILFSGDIGAAILPEHLSYSVVEDFSFHACFMEGFHRRYMSGNAAMRAWVSMVRKLDIETIAPQHGAVFPRAVVPEFLAWLENLECGVDLCDEWYSTELL